MKQTYPLRAVIGLRCHFPVLRLHAGTESPGIAFPENNRADKGCGNSVDIRYLP